MAGTPEERFRAHLDSQGKRLTRERKIVCEVAFRTVMPFTMEEFCERLMRSREGARVSRSTIYRTLLEMQKAGLLRKSDRPNEVEFFD